MILSSHRSRWTALSSFSRCNFNPSSSGRFPATQNENADGSVGMCSSQIESFQLKISDFTLAITRRCGEEIVYIHENKKKRQILKCRILDLLRLISLSENSYETNGFPLKELYAHRPLT